MKGNGCNWFYLNGLENKNDGRSLSASPGITSGQENHFLGAEQEEQSPEQEADDGLSLLADSL
jgi:hypothetical protein